MKATILLALIFVFAFSCSECLAIEHVRFHSTANGYSIEMPKDWTKLPDNILQGTFKQLIAKAIEPPIFIWEVAFQPETKGLQLQCPYAIVQVSQYSDCGLNRQMYQNEISEYVKTMTGYEIEDTIERGFSAENQELLSSVEYGKVLLDSKNRCYLFNVEMNATGGSKVKGQMKGYFGKYAIIQVMFYDWESNWSNSSLERNTFFNSFEFDPSMAYDETLKNKVGIFDRLGQAGLRGIGYALIAVILGLSIGLFKLANNLIHSKKKPKDGQNQ